MKMIVLSVLALVTVSLCSQPEPAYTEQQAIDACVGLCTAATNAGKYLSIGPCLSDTTGDWTPNWKITDWVCDVAHSPREASDNIPTNQCSAYTEGKAKHFVEVSSNCTFIRAS
jgi:hypothetical protein